MKQGVVVKSLICSLMLYSVSAGAAITSCETIKDKVDARLDSKGVSNYTLKVVLKDTPTKLRVVGVCEGGKKKIIYQKDKRADKTDE